MYPKHLLCIVLVIWEIACGNSMAHKLLLVMIHGNVCLVNEIARVSGYVLPSPTNCVFPQPPVELAAYLKNNNPTDAAQLMHPY